MHGTEPRRAGLPDPAAATLTDGVVQVRPLAEHDAHALFEAISESLPQLSTWLTWCRPDYNPYDSIAYILKAQADWQKGVQFNFGTFDVKTQALLGSVALNHIAAVHKSANLGYWVRSSKAGQGIATAAVKLIAKFAFQTLGLNRLEIIVPVGTPVYGRMVYDTYRYRSLHYGGQDTGIGFTGSSTSGYYDSFSDSWMVLADAGQTSAFSTTDFFNVAVLAGKLAGRADPVSQYLWNQFDATTQQVLTNSSSTFDQLKSALAGALNSIINTKAVYDSNRFAAVTLSTETRVFKAINPQYKELVRFNRLLLEDAYPADIVRSPSTPTGRYYFGMAFDSARRAAVVMGGYYGGAGPNPLNGNDTWELLYLDTPLINDQPASQYRAPGDTAVFTVNAVAPYESTLSYDWYLGTNALNDGARISGAHSATVQIANVSVSDEGQYQARIFAPCGMIYTAPAILTMSAKLQIFRLGENSGRLIWSAVGLVLQQGDSLKGPWTTVEGATSPYDLTFQNATKFFRLNTNSPAGP